MDTIKEGYTRVSTVLAQWDKFGHIDREMVARKAELGTRVHEAISNHHDNLFIPLGNKEQPYFDSYMAWENSLTGYTIVENEKRLYCDDLMITGQCDAIMKFSETEEPCLIDYKTSASSSKEMWSLQAAFYHYLAVKNGFKISNRVIFLQLDKYGKMPKVHEFIITKELQIACMSAYNIFSYLKKWLEEREKLWQNLKS